MTMTPSLSIQCGNVQARIALRGAELTSLRYCGRESIWHGDPAWWSYSAPILFPVIGRLPDQQILHKGRTLQMPLHGFARDLPFTVADAGPAHAELVLRASPQTLEMYPFQFELHVRFEVRDDGLHQRVRVANVGAERMPASFGFHPAFCWPARQSHRGEHSIRFTHEESRDCFGIDKNGFLVPRPQQVPMRERTLLLDDALFASSAVIFNPVASNGLEYRDQDGLLLALAWSGCQQFGLWTRPGAPFICFEPWHGHANPLGFTGELSAKPGGFALQPGASKLFELSVRF